MYIAKDSTPILINSINLDNIGIHRMLLKSGPPKSVWKQTVWTECLVQVQVQGSHGLVWCSGKTGSEPNRTELNLTLATLNLWIPQESFRSQAQPQLPPHSKTVEARWVIMLDIDEGWVMQLRWFGRGYLNKEVMEGRGRKGPGLEGFISPNTVTWLFDHVSECIGQVAQGGTITGYRFFSFRFFSFRFFFAIDSFRIF